MFLIFFNNINLSLERNNIIAESSTQAYIFEISHFNNTYIHDVYKTGARNRDKMSKTLLQKFRRTIKFICRSKVEESGNTKSYKELWYFESSLCL